MIIFVLILITLCLNGIEITGKNEFHKDYSGIKQSRVINGIFTVIVFLSHASTYINISNSNSPFDSSYITMKNFFLQLIVVPFLFYSGFGMMESISKNYENGSYVKSIPTKRLFRVWYKFAIAIMLFLLLRICTNRAIDLKNTLLAFTGYTSIGNSNWYMLAIFVSYILVFVSFMVFRKSKLLAIISVLALSFGVIFIEKRIGLPTYYYDTFIAFGLGIAYSYAKPFVDKIIMKHDNIWFVVMGLLVLLFVYIKYTLLNEGLRYHLILAALASVIMVVLTMKVKINNSILNWFGEHVFSIYILQRIPMIILSDLGFNVHKYAFVVLSFAATIVIAVLFDCITANIDKLIYSRASLKRQELKK